VKKRDWNEGKSWVITKTCSPDRSDLRASMTEARFFREAYVAVHSISFLPPSATKKSALNTYNREVVGEIAFATESASLLMCTIIFDIQR
jgi:hypothetical protein